MHIRCKGCHGTIWVERQGSAEPLAVLQCRTYGQDYRLEEAHRLRPGEKRLAREARKIAKTYGIDMPGAYSVLFGMMSAEDVLELGHNASTACRSTAVAPPSTEPGKRIPYDSAWQPAIDAGLLTAYQAAQRGQRERYALMISNRHGLPMSVAYNVADNQVSLLNCLRDRRPGEGDETVLNVPAPDRSVLWVALSISALLIAAVVLHFASSVVSRGSIAVRTILGAEVRTDSQGQVVRVAGPDPRSVLTAYCASRPEPAIEPVDIIPSARHGADVRLGLFREKDNPSNIYMIDISEDRAAAGWVVGDGAAPVIPAPAPRGAAEVRRRPAPRRGTETITAGEPASPPE